MAQPTAQISQNVFTKGSQPTMIAALIQHHAKEQLRKRNPDPLLSILDDPEVEKIARDTVALLSNIGLEPRHAHSHGSVVTTPSASQDEPSQHEVVAPRVVDPEWKRTVKHALIALDSMDRINMSAKSPGMSSGGKPFGEELTEFLEKKAAADRAARMAALRANDADAYMAHLQNVKLGSLLHVMEVTERFMRGLGARLEEQQLDNTESHHARKAKPQQSDDVEESDEQRRFRAYVASTKNEYKLVHRNSVFVEEQPKGLDATLMPHQMVGLRFLSSLQANNINGILADEMGVGKTLQTIAFLMSLREGGVIHGPHLILAPLSIVREWRESIENFASQSMKVCEFHELKGPADAKNYDLVLLAINRVRMKEPEVCAINWSFIVVDEAHKAVANTATLTAQSILAIPYKHRLVLTGTPLNNDIQELWSLLNFINPRLFSDKLSFAAVFQRPFAQQGIQENEAQLNEEERGLLVMRLHQILRPFMLRRTKRDIDTSLRITYHRIICPITPLQRELLRVLREESKLPSMADDECRLAATITKTSSAQSICNAAFMLPFFSQLCLREDIPLDQVGDLTMRTSGKLLVLDFILRRMRAVGKKVVIFSHFLDMIDLLVEHLEFRGWGDCFVALTGATSTDERKSSVHRFRTDPSCLVFVVSMKAGGCGLNLQVASTIIMFDKDYTATNEDQAVARVFRIGQKNTVRALYLEVDDDCENRVTEIADRKNKPRQALIEGGGYDAVEVEDDERRRLLNDTMTGPETHRLSFESLVTEHECSSQEEAGAVAPSSASLQLRHCLDPIICGDDPAALESLGALDLDVELPAATLQAMPAFLKNGYDECTRPREDLGRGKRLREDADDDARESDDDMPPAAFLERAEDDGVDIEEAIEKYRTERRAAQRKRFEEALSALGAAACVTDLTASLDASIATTSFANHMTCELTLRKTSATKTLTEFLGAAFDR